MKARRKKFLFQVTGHGINERVVARTAGRAVDLCRWTGAKPRTDPETGGWKGVSITCLGEHH